MVSTLARLFAVTFSICWCASSPLIAEYIPGIISTSLPFAASSGRAGRCCGADSWCQPRCSCDHGAVDVGEDMRVHGLWCYRGEHGVVLDGCDEGRPIHEHD